MWATVHLVIMMTIAFSIRRLSKERHNQHKLSLVIIEPFRIRREKFIFTITGVSNYRISNVIKIAVIDKHKIKCTIFQSMHSENEMLHV
jgi:hypothetical protein